MSEKATCQHYLSSQVDVRCGQPVTHTGRHGAACERHAGQDSVTIAPAGVQAHEVRALLDALPRCERCGKAPAVALDIECEPERSHLCGPCADYRKANDRCDLYPLPWATPAARVATRLATPDAGACGATSQGRPCIERVAHTAWQHHSGSWWVNHRADDGTAWSTPAPEAGAVLEALAREAGPSLLHERDPAVVTAKLTVWLTRAAAHGAAEATARAEAAEHDLVKSRKAAMLFEKSAVFRGQKRKEAEAERDAARTRADQAEARERQLRQQVSDLQDAAQSRACDLGRRVSDRDRADRAEAALATMRSTIDGALAAVLAESERQKGEREMDVRAGLLNAVEIVRERLASALEPKP